MLCSITILATRCSDDIERQEMEEFSLVFSGCFATFATIVAVMKKQNYFGTLRLHTETIDALKKKKREREVLINEDLTWDEFVMDCLINASGIDE